ncbi:hypothetical protein [Isobaculum melis]|uniref:Uncharacterized protein n=1 Tax=Isobaculum melis TaxID=142588 RepID=A0A1H9U140_9LACT|nr:hypothetical protein [Isobaculum melis]SES02803.1 hypothetical protein SAMN04488559_11914 [Isobaculum melis]
MDKEHMKIIELARKVMDDSYKAIDLLVDGNTTGARKRLEFARDSMEQLWYEIGVVEGMASSGKDVSKLMYLMQYVYMASCGLTMAKGKVS